MKRTSVDSRFGITILHGGPIAFENTTYDCLDNRSADPENSLLCSTFNVFLPVNF